MASSLRGGLYEGFHCTALSITTKQKSTKIIQLLIIRSGAEVDHVDNEGISPLILTCCDDQELVRDTLKVLENHIIFLLCIHFQKLMSTVNNRNNLSEL